MSQHILYFVSEDWYFCSHRWALAQTALQQGFQVSVLTHVNQHGDRIAAAGFNLIPLNMERTGINPFKELQTLLQIYRVYQTLKPDRVHHIALKPVVYGSLVACFCPKLKAINLIAGLGSVFTSNRLKAKLLRPFVTRLLRHLLRRKNTEIIVQNSEDRDLLQHKLQISPAHIHLIPGSGVDIARFAASPDPKDPVRIALVARLLWDKGVGEYIEAIKILQQRGLNFTALLVGEPDDKNLGAISKSQLQTWQQQGLVSCLGFVEDVASVWRDCHIAVLPSYREGFPKSLLEAAACGRAIVTTDTSGCKELVKHGVNGLLVPVKDAKALAAALEKLILDAPLRQVMGQAGRKMVEQQFADSHIIAQTLKLYQLESAA